MADGRMLSRSIARSKQLARLHPLSAMLFAYLIPHQDSFGRMDGDPEIVKHEAVPLLAYFTPEVVAACLQELATCRDGRGEPLIWWYEVGGDPVIEFPGFERHNTIYRKRTAKKSRFPGRDDDGAKPFRPPTSQLPRLHGLRGFTHGVRTERDMLGRGPLLGKKERMKEVPSESSVPSGPSSGPVAASAGPVGAAAALPSVSALASGVAAGFAPVRVAS